MQRIARGIGYSTTFIIMMLVLWLLWTINQDRVLGPYKIQVAFPNVGTLMEDDPVKIQGVTVGKVIDIERRNEAALVTLEIFKRKAISRHSHFINYNYSLFGSRMILLIPSDEEVALNPQEIQEGYFLDGVSESIHRMGELLSFVMQVQSKVQFLHQGSSSDSSSQSLQALFTNKLYPLAHAYAQLSQDFTAFEKATEQQSQSLQQEMASAQKMTKHWRQHSDSLLQVGQAAIDKINQFTDQNAKFLQNIDRLTQAIADTSAGLPKALLQRELYDQLLAFDHDLQGLLKILRHEGLQEAIHFWRNIHILGNNPTHTQHVK